MVRVQSHFGDRPDSVGDGGQSSCVTTVDSEAMTDCSLPLPTSVSVPNLSPLSLLKVSCGSVFLHYISLGLSESSTAR